MAVKIQVRRGTAAQWTSANPTLSDGEWGVETDTRKFKIGNGATAWNSLLYSTQVIPWGNITGTLTDQADLLAALALKQDNSGKDATGGYAGLTLLKINFKNALNTFTSFFTNANTGARTYTFQDRDGTIADDTDLNLKSDKATRTASAVSTATLTPNVDTHDMAVITAQAEALAIAAPTGTPSNGNAFAFRIKDNGTARALTFNAIYRAIGSALPTTTTLSKTLYFVAVYNSTDTKWDVFPSNLEV